MDEKTNNAAVEVTGRYAVIYGSVTSASYVTGLVALLNTYAEMGYRVIGVTPLGSTALAYTLENTSGDKEKSR